MATRSRTKRKSPSRRVRQVRYAVVALGHIAQAAVLPAFAHATKNSRLAAVISDDPEKLRKLARRYGVDRTGTYDDYPGLLESGEVDAVYIALPNHLHAEFAIEAARAGIHVLCEKPMAVTPSECRQMIEARDRSGVRMMIAYRLHFERANLQAIEVAQSGKLGTLRYFQSTFSLPVRAGNIRVDADKGGGPLLDIGIYCINAARYLFRQDPIEVSAMSATRHDDQRFRDVDEMFAVSMRFPDERLASFVASFGAASTASFQIVGDKGHLRVDNAYEYTTPITHTLTVNGRTRTREFAKRDQFAPQLLYFLQLHSPESPARTVS